MFPHISPLLAQRDWNTLAGRLRPDPRVDWSQMVWLFALLALLIVGFLASQMIAKMRRRWAEYSPSGLFRDLCRLHKLSWSDGRLLRFLAAQQRLTQPALLFIDSARLTSARTSSLSASQQARVERLRKRLFDVV